MGAPQETSSERRDDAAALDSGTSLLPALAASPLGTSAVTETIRVALSCRGGKMAGHGKHIHPENNEFCVLRSRVD
jgi:hypothetical protein